MDRKSKILLTIFICVLLASVAVTFYRYIILEDIVFYTDEEAFAENLLEE